MAQHSHKYNIADDDAVHALVDKLTSGGTRQLRRDKLLRALDDATLQGFRSEGPAGILSRTADRLCGRAEALIAFRSREKLRSARTFG